MQTEKFPDEEETIIKDPSEQIEDDEITQSTFSYAQREKKRLSFKPDISTYSDAVETLPDGEKLLLLDVGDSVLIERRANIMSGSRWLDTRKFIINGIDDVTGVVTLWDPKYDQNHKANYLLDTGYLFKIPGTKKSKPASQEKKPRKARVRRNKSKA